MQRRNFTPRRPRYNRSVKPRGRMLARTRNGFTQRVNGPSHQDNVPQVRKFQVFKECFLENSTTDYSFGLTNFNIHGSQSPLKPLLQSYATLYEQYRIRKINIRAQVGRNYDNDRRIKTIVGCRVDVDANNFAATSSNLQAVNCAENTILRTFTERGNVLLAKYRPQCRVNTTASLPVLPNRLQFYPIGDVDTHIWKGAIVTVMIPDTAIAPNALSITLMAEVDVEFRGRITDPTTFTSNTINQHTDSPPVTYDLEEPQLTLRDKLLTGAYQPLTAWPINIGNIGSTVQASEIIGLTFRRNSDMVKFTIEMYADDQYGANSFT